MTSSDQSPPGGTPSRGWQIPSTEELNAILPAYRFLALIGRGGMGAVFKATQVSLNRPVAIKVLPTKLLEDADANLPKRFRQEALTMARLTHPGIVSVYESGESQGLLYIVMEFIDGADLARTIREKGKITPELSSQWLIQVCEALQCAHQNGVVHRDLKPANLLINRDGRVKIADFGLAQHHDEALRGLTRTNLSIGTPDFLAPEAWTPNTTLDGRADLYALGVTLYQMLTGEIPRGFWEMPSDRVGTDPRFDAIIERAMQPKPDARYQSAAELQLDLERIGTGAAAPRPPQNSPETVTTPAGGQRPRSFAVLAVLCGAALLAFLWLNYAGRGSRLQAGIVVTSLDDDGGQGSLRHLLHVATNGSTLVFAPKLAGQTLWLTRGELHVEKSVILDASALPGGVRIDGAGKSRILRIEEGTSVLLDSLTLTNGRTKLDGGAGIHNLGSLAVQRCTLAGNTAAVMPDPEFEDSVFEAENRGGAIYSLGPLTVSQSLFLNNSAREGGGVFSTKTDVTLENSTFLGNQAVTGGAAAIAVATSTTLRHLTICSNTATGADRIKAGGGGLFFYVTKDIVMQNCLIVGNSSPYYPDLQLAGWEVLSGGGNLVGNSDGYFATPRKNDRFGLPGGTPPQKFAPLGDHGGPTMTLLPLPGSLALDRGVSSSLTNDQRGFPRPLGEGPDIGAVEVGTR